jgi:hypothetical protein
MKRARPIRRIGAALAGLLGAAACSAPSQSTPPSSEAAAPSAAPAAPSISPTAVPSSQPDEAPQQQTAAPGVEPVGPAAADTAAPALDVSPTPRVPDTRPKPAESRGIPTISVREPTVGPSYPPEIIRRVIRQNWARIAACFEKSKIEASPSKAALRFTIGTDGKVTEAAWVEQGKAIEPDPVRLCVLNTIRGLAFPEPRGKIVVTYPFNVDAVE